MIGRRLPVAVAVGLIGLGAPAGAAAAGQTAAWPYVVSSASGSAVWQYSGPNGGGVDSVGFKGRAHRAHKVLRVTTTYVDRTSQGCGPLRHIKTRNYRAPSFSIQGASVVVTWRFPLPKPAYCLGASASSVSQLLPVGAFSQRVPLSRFTCSAVSLKLVGEASLPQGGTSGTLTFQATIVLKRRNNAVPVTMSM
jgi:hypothetical protein